MDLHPAENRGYRELYLTGSATSRRLSRLASAFEGHLAEATLRRASDAVAEMLDELRPLTARHNLHSRLAAEGGGEGIGAVRSAVVDRFLERNQALRFAAGDLEHLATLLSYLGAVSTARGGADLASFGGAWEKRLRRHLGAVRKAIRELGSDPDLAVRPLDESPVGRAAHGVAWAFGTVGEWTDRQVGRRRKSG